MRASSSPVTSERMKRGEKILDTTAKNIRRRRGQCESHAMAYTHASPGAIPLCAYFPKIFHLLLRSGALIFFRRLRRLDIPAVKLLIRTSKYMLID